MWNEQSHPQSWKPVCNHCVLTVCNIMLNTHELHYKLFLYLLLIVRAQRDCTASRGILLPVCVILASHGQSVSDPAEFRRLLKLVLLFLLLTFIDCFLLFVQLNLVHFYVIQQFFPALLTFGMHFRQFITGGADVTRPCPARRHVSPVQCVLFLSA